MRKIHHVCIQTDDYKASLDFYMNIMGFEMVKESPNFHKRSFNTWLKLEDFMIELQTGKEGESLTKPSSKSEGLVHMCFLVEDVKAEVARIQALGYNNFKEKHGGPIYEVEGSALSKVIAPEGTIIELRDIADLG